MIWRVILFCLLGSSLALANLPKDSRINLTNDGTRAFVYDANNQLTNVNVAGAWKTEFAYDGLGRRRIERDYTWQSGAWVRTNETRLICDGMLPVQERDSNNVVQVTYTRGLDLSLSLGGAGGIGGLLGRTDTNGSTFFHTDGAGNVTALMDANENIVARYEYDGFGRVIGQWGTMASVNTMQFSSMPRLGASGLIGYPDRDYDPGLMRWLNHDPAGERFDLNLYRFNYNAPLQYVDPNGKNPLVIALIVGAVWGAVMTPSTANAPGPNDPTYPGLTGEDILGGAIGGAIGGGVTYGVLKFPEAFGGPSGVKPSPTFCPAPKPLFRAVTDTELQSIMDNGGFSVVPNSSTPIPSVDGKWFYETLADAQSWAKAAASVDGDPLTIVRTSVPSAVTPVAISQRWADGIANPSVFYSLSSVNSAPVTVVSGPIH